MKRKLLYALWAFLFSLCAGLGFIPEPEGLMKKVLTAISLAVFLPPALLLYFGGVTDTKLIRNLSALSLGLTTLLLILNFFTAFGSETLGQVMHYVLIIVTSPMICSGHWAMSMFLWACLLMVSIHQFRR